MSAEISASFVAITALLSTIVVGTVIGNLFVIIAILVDKNLQTPANQLVLSLACSDLMVACLVMPLGAYNDVNQGWFLGKEVCEFWTSADVLCCTASILHLLAIALDRYWAVTNADYIYRRTRARMNTMIVCAWTVGAVVSLAPIFGWKDPDFAQRVLSEHKCLVSQDVGYQLFATIASFYAPLVLLLALYWRIFQVALRRIRRKPGGQSSAAKTAHHRCRGPSLAQVVVAGRAALANGQVESASASAAASAALRISKAEADNKQQAEEQSDSNKSNGLLLSVSSLKKGASDDDDGGLVVDVNNRQPDEGARSQTPGRWTARHWRRLSEVMGSALRLAGSEHERAHAPAGGSSGTRRRRSSSGRRRQLRVVVVPVGGTTSANNDEPRATAECKAAAAGKGETLNGSSAECCPHSRCHLTTTADQLSVIETGGEGWCNYCECYCCCRGQLATANTCAQCRALEINHGIAAHAYLAGPVIERESERRQDKQHFSLADPPTTSAFFSASHYCGAGDAEPRENGHKIDGHRALKMETGERGSCEPDDEAEDGRSEASSLSGPFPPPLASGPQSPARNAFEAGNDRLSGTCQASADALTLPHLATSGKPAGRALGLRQKFRALGQLVSFVQTSRNFNSCSSSSAAQNSSVSAGEEEDEDDEDDEDDDGDDDDENGEEQLQAAPGEPANHLQSVPVEPVGAVDSSSKRRESKRNSKALVITTTTTTTVGNVVSHQQQLHTSPPLNQSAGKQQQQQQVASHAAPRARRENMEMKRERKAAKTLAIITGVFVCCWLPFFLNAIIMPVCGPSCTPSDLILSVLLWLGYLNSLLNPIIYTIFSPDFRRAFRRLLCWPERAPGPRAPPRPTKKPTGATK